MANILHDRPEYYFTLYLDNLYTADLSKRIAICTNANHNPMATLDNSYKYIYTGESQAVSVSKTLDANPSEFGEIPLSVINQNIINSRQLIGTNFKLTLTTFLSLTPSEVIVATGTVGQVTSSATKVRLELVSDNERLKTDERYKVSYSCMNTLGTGKCTVNRQTLVLPCTNVLSGRNVVTSFSGSFDPNSEYELIIGTTRYLVDKSNSSGGTIRIVGLIQGVPQKITLQRHCNQTIAQCQKYNNLAQFNGCVFLETDGINVAL